MNMFDFDGVVSIGLCPRPGDVIVTGRGFDECEFVRTRLIEILGPYLASKIPIFFNMKLKGQGRTRRDSANHKADILAQLLSHGHQIETIFEDDPEQYTTLSLFINEYFDGPDRLIRREKPKLCFINCPWIEK